MLTIAAVVLCTLAGGQPQRGDPSASSVPFTAVTLTDPFWAPRQRANATGTLDQNWTQCEKTGRIENLQRAGDAKTGGYQGYFFNDSDVFKMLEGASNLLARNNDRQLRRRVDKLAGVVSGAQQPDGYLNSYFTIAKPDEKWTNLKDMHELYCAGHLIEAGVAHSEATGRTSLLDTAVRLAACIEAKFGPGKTSGVCGHPEIELALIRLYEHTGDPRHLEMARYFLHERGKGTGRPLLGQYCQDHAPLAEQRQVVGHAVRAMYLYSAATDLARIDGDAPMADALTSLWDNLTLRKMYVTGGIGNSAQNEGFTTDYDLPNESAYAETCASIGLAMWARRMNVLTGDAKYADVMERVLYNAVASGVSLDGCSFFYVNPLAARGGVSRQEWFSCACCPPNVLRLLSSIEQYQYVQRPDGLSVNLYAAGTARPPAWGGAGQITQESRYPWDGRVTLRVEAPADRGEWTLRLRIPDWCRSHSLRVNGSRVDAKVSRGYAELTRRWGRGDTVELVMDMPVQRVVSHPAVSGNAGRVAIRRGPIVYCAEQADNPDGVSNIVLPAESPISEKWEPELLGGVVVLTAAADRQSGVFPSDRLYEPRGEGRPATLRLVPYCTWANRGAGEMTVWLAESPSAGLRAGKAWLTPSVSHCYASDTVDALCDDVWGEASADTKPPRMTWWPRKASEQWARYDFEPVQTVNACTVQWFDDTGRGECAPPESWRLEWTDDGAVWHPVELVAGSTYGIALDTRNEVRFAPVTCRALRLVAQLKPGKSGGIIEWALSRVP